MPKHSKKVSNSLQKEEKVGRKKKVGILLFSIILFIPLALSFFLLLLEGVHYFFELAIP
jgi:hypothetical protein